MAFYNTERERIHPVYMCFNVYMYIRNTSLTTEQTVHVTIAVLTGQRLHCMRQYAVHFFCVDVENVVAVYACTTISHLCMCVLVYLFPHLPTGISAH